MFVSAVLTKALSLNFLDPAFSLFGNFKLQSLLIFFVSIIGFSLIVVFHELGHYLFARMFNVKVVEFSVGFITPKWIPTFRDKNGTTWKFGLIPLGGYVGMLIEPSSNGSKIEDMSIINIERNAQPEEFPDEDKVVGIYLNECSKLKKIIILLAGPFFNFIFSFLIMSFIYIIFGQPLVGFNIKEDYGPFKKGNLLQIINGKRFLDRSHFNYLLQKDKENRFGFLKNDLSIEEVELPFEGKGGVIDLISGGYLKYECIYSLNNYIDLKLFLESISLSGNYLKTMLMINSTAYLNLIKNISNGRGVKGAAGPIGLIGLAIENSRQGLPYFLTYLATISIAIGFFNLLPIPPLDGGHIVFILLQLVFGESKLLEFLFTRIAMVMVYLLLGITFFADFGRFINPIYSKSQTFLSKLFGKNIEEKK